MDSSSSWSQHRTMPSAQGGLKDHFNGHTMLDEGKYVLNGVGRLGKSVPSYYLSQRGKEEGKMQLGVQDKTVTSKNSRDTPQSYGPVYSVPIFISLLFTDFGIAYCFLSHLLTSSSSLTRRKTAPPRYHCQKVPLIQRFLQDLAVAKC